MLSRCALRSSRCPYMHVRAAWACLSRLGSPPDRRQLAVLRDARLERRPGLVARGQGSIGRDSRREFGLVHALSPWRLGSGDTAGSLAARLLRGEHRGLAGLDHVLRAAHRARGIERQDLADDEPVEDRSRGARRSLRSREAMWEGIQSRASRTDAGARRRIETVVAPAPATPLATPASRPTTRTSTPSAPVSPRPAPFASSPTSSRASASSAPALPNSSITPDPVTACASFASTGSDAHSRSCSKPSTASKPTAFTWSASRSASTPRRRPASSCSTSSAPSRTYERRLISERTRDGIAAARSRPLLRLLQHQAPSQRTGPTHPGCGVLRPGSPRFGSLKPEEDFTYHTVQFSGSISDFVGERHASGGRRWATRQRCPRSVSTAPRALAGPRDSSTNPQDSLRKHRASWVWPGQSWR